MSKKSGQPPKIAEWLLETLLSPEHNSVLGDLTEEFFDRIESTNSFWATVVYWTQAIKTIPVFLFHNLIWSGIMLSNYFKIAMRNFLKHKWYSLINLAGLAVGMTSCMLISLYVQDELRYDRYHENADRIFRLVNSSRSHVGVPWAPAIEQELPEVEHAVRILDSPGGPTKLIAYGEKRFVQERFFYADRGIFEVFSWPLVQGNPSTALKDPFSVVITEEIASKFFGDTQPLGKTITVDNEREFVVTGVVQSIPRQSHMQFELLASMSTVLALDAADQWGSPLSWTNPFVDTYLLLSSAASPASVERKLPGLLRRNFPQGYRGGIDLDDTQLQPLTDIHLNSGVSDDFDPQGSIVYIYLFSILAIFIVVMACINFMNLATARSQNRARETGIRKVLGAFRIQVMKQFLGESLFLSLLSLLIAMLLLEASLPLLNNLTGKSLQMNYLQNLSLSFGFIILALFVGVLAGGYPAFFLSAFSPAVVLKSGKDPKSKGAVLRKGLVVFQFTISIMLIIGTSLLYQQLNFLKNKSLGFEKEQIVVMPFRGSSALRQKTELLKQKVLQNPNIISASASHSLPGHWLNRFYYLQEGKPRDERVVMGDLVVDHDFVDMYGLQIIAGRSFSKNLASDSSSFIINESAMSKFGWQSPQVAVGQRLEWMGPGRPKGSVIGVVKDFHFHSLHKEVPPLVIHITDWQKSFLSVRIQSENIASTLAFLEQTWAEIDPVYPFQYYFLDKDFARKYQAEERLTQIFGYFSMLAIFIGCLGLLGLASFTAQQRTKEIGLRKVFGASVPGIVVMLSKDFTKLIFISFVIASPVTYFAMQKWLQNFAYHISVGTEIFLAAGLFILIIACLTVSYQAVRAAYTNPVTALKHE